MADVVLSEVEARELILAILDGVEAAEAEIQPTDTWAPEMRLWVDLILNRLGFRP